MNVNLMENADHKNIVTTGSAKKLAHNAAKERRALVFQTTELSVNARKDTLDRLLLNAVQNALEMSIVPDQDQLVIMESVRTLAMVLVEQMLIVIFVD